MMAGILVACCLLVANAAALSARAPVHAIAPASRQAIAPARALAPRMDELWDSLRSRIASTDGDGPPVLGVEDIGADQMGPQDVVEHVLKSLKSDTDAGLTAFLQFSLSTDGEPVDHLGQLQPGFFCKPDELGDYLGSSADGRYRIITTLGEYKCMGAPRSTDMSRGAEQKLLVRSEADWKELFVNLRLMPFEPVPRWVITSIYMSGN